MIGFRISLREASVISSLRKAKARNLRLADWLRFLGAVPNVDRGSRQPLEMTRGAGRHQARTCRLSALLSAISAAATVVSRNSFRPDGSSFVGPQKKRTSS